MSSAAKNPFNKSGNKKDSKPRLKKSASVQSKKKIILASIAMLLVVLGLGVALVVSQQVQDLRQQASVVGPLATSCSDFLSYDACPTSAGCNWRETKANTCLLQVEDHDWNCPKGCDPVEFSSSCGSLTVDECDFPCFVDETNTGAKFCGGENFTSFKCAGGNSEGVCEGNYSGEGEISPTQPPAAGTTPEPTENPNPDGSTPADAEPGQTGETSTPPDAPAECGTVEMTVQRVNQETENGSYNVEVFSTERPGNIVIVVEDVNGQKYEYGSPDVVNQGGDARKWIWYFRASNGNHAGLQVIDIPFESIKKVDFYINRKKSGEAVCATYTNPTPETGRGVNRSSSECDSVNLSVNRVNPENEDGSYNIEATSDLPSGNVAIFLEDTNGRQYEYGSPEIINVSESARKWVWHFRNFNGDHPGLHLIDLPFENIKKARFMVNRYHDGEATCATYTNNNAQPPEASVEPRGNKGSGASCERLRQCKEGLSCYTEQEIAKANSTLEKNKEYTKSKGVQFPGDKCTTISSIAFTKIFLQKDGKTVPAYQNSVYCNEGSLIWGQYLAEQSDGHIAGYADSQAAIFNKGVKPDKSRYPARCKTVTAQTTFRLFNGDYQVEIWCTDKNDANADKHPNEGTLAYIAQIGTTNQGYLKYEDINRDAWNTWMNGKPMIISEMRGRDNGAGYNQVEVPDECRAVTATTKIAIKGKNAYDQLIWCSTEKTKDKGVKMFYKRCQASDKGGVDYSNCSGWNWYLASDSYRKDMRGQSISELNAQNPSFVPSACVDIDAMETFKVGRDMYESLLYCKDNKGTELTYRKYHKTGSEGWIDYQNSSEWNWWGAERICRDKLEPPTAKFSGGCSPADQKWGNLPKFAFDIKGDNLKGEKLQLSHIMLVFTLNDGKNDAFEQKIVDFLGDYWWGTKKSNGEEIHVYSLQVKNSYNESLADGKVHFNINHLTKIGNGGGPVKNFAQLAEMAKQLEGQHPVAKDYKFTISANLRVLGREQLDYVPSQVKIDIKRNACSTKPKTPTPTKVKPSPTKVKPSPTKVKPSPTKVKPSATPTDSPHKCGYSPCQADKDCKGNLICVKPNKGKVKYCAKPQFEEACKAKPNYDSCCTYPATKFNLLVKLAGVPEVEEDLQGNIVNVFHPIEKHETILMDLVIQNSGGKGMVVKEDFAFTYVKDDEDGSGSFYKMAKPLSLGKFPTGLYRFYLKGPMHRQQEFCSLKQDEGGQCGLTDFIAVVAGSDEVYDFTAVELDPGDIPLPNIGQDGKIDVRDFSFVASCLMLDAQDSNYEKKKENCEARADLNFSGEVTNKDLSLLKQSLGVAYDL